MIGGSTAMGYPYDPTISIGQVVAGLEVDQSRPGLAVVWTSTSGRTWGGTWKTCTRNWPTPRRRPDALIVFSGHNEFLSNFETMRDAGYAEASQGPCRTGSTNSACTRRSAFGFTRPCASIASAVHPRRSTIIS